MNLLNGLKTYLLGSGTIGAVIATYLGPGMPAQLAAVFILGSLTLMALRHGMQRATIQMAEAAAALVAKNAPNVAIKDVAIMFDDAFKKALAEGTAKPAAAPAAPSQ